MKYKYKVYFTTSAEVEVEANSQEEAEQMAKCVDGTTLGVQEQVIENLEPINDVSLIKTNIAVVIWDTDGEEIDGLPSEVEVPDDIDDDDVSDWLSDEYGFCVEKWYWISDKNFSEEYFECKT